MNPSWSCARSGFVAAVWCLLGILAGPAFAAADSALFASVWRIRGEVAVVRGEAGGERNLREGEAVMVGDRVRAASSAEAVLKTADGGMIAVRPGAEFVAERFAAEGRSTDHFSLRLVTGALRVITGWIGRVNRAEHRIVTPSATIGIRGTDHEPYVMSAAMAGTLSQLEGTYDKVNRGGTTLDVNGQKLDIDPGRVGFVRGSRIRTRALMTVLLPVLLDKVPDFYVPGQFDAELDRYSRVAEETSQRQLAERQRSGSAEPERASPAAAAAAGDTPAIGTAAVTQGERAAPQNLPPGCLPTDIARTWLGRLDSAIARHDAPTIIALFAPEVTVRASVRGSDGGLTTLELGRDELAKSTIAAIRGLKNYKQRRPSIEGRLDESASEGSCSRIGVRSVVIEQGTQSGKPYRFESLEEYLLERQSGRWVAIKAATTQR